MTALEAPPRQVATQLQVPDFTPKHVVFIDFESYYDKNYKLRKMTTAEYVRDPRFEILMVGVKIDGAEAVLMEHEEFKAWSSTWDWPSTALGAHSPSLEPLVCADHYGIFPGFWFDTISMARALGLEANLKFLMDYFGVGQKGDELANMMGKRRKDFTDAEFAAAGIYCLTDVEGCAAIFDKMSPAFPESELWLINLIIRMFSEPQLLLDEPMLREYMVEEKARKAALLAQAGLDKKSVGSNEKLAAAFRELGVEPPKKISPKTKKEVYAFAKNDVGMLALLEHEVEEVRWLAEARIAVKSTINESRGGRFLQLGKGGRPMSVQLKHYGAHTGRLSGDGKCNFQNLERTNKKDPKKGRLKKSLLAPPGYKVVAVDSGAIEARGVAWVAEHKVMIEAFAQNRDLYSEQASSIYGRTIDRKKNAEDEIPGFVGKVCIAENELVLTHRGLIPIQDVQSTDRLWDGIEWVTHDGVIYNGVREVLNYAGLRATVDHEVFLENGRKVAFGEAASSMDRIARTEDAGQAIRFARDCVAKNSTPQRQHPGQVQVQRDRPDEVGVLGERVQREIDLVPQERETTATECRGTGTSIRRDRSSLYQTIVSAVYRLRTTWHQMLLQIQARIRSMDAGNVPVEVLLGLGVGPDRHEWELRSRQYPTRHTKGQREQQTKHTFRFVPGAATATRGGDRCVTNIGSESTVRQLHAEQSVAGNVYRSGNSSLVHGEVLQTERVYDIANAGPRHRFTVSGRLVANCVLGLGYGQGWLKLGENFLKGVSGPPVQFTMTEVEILNVDLDKFMSDERKMNSVVKVLSRLEIESRVIHYAVADHLVKKYRKVNAPIPALWRFMGDVIKAMEKGIEGFFGPNDCLQTVKNGILLPNGMELRYPELRQSKRGDYPQDEDEDDEPDAEAWRRKGFSYFDGQKRSRIYGGLLLENVCQALARIVVTDQMLHVRAVTGYRPCLSTHDEWAYVAPDSDAVPLKHFVIETMKTPPHWARGWPLNAEGGHGQSYGAK